MVILDQLDMPEGVSLQEAAALARAAGDITEDEIVVLVNRELGLVEYGTAADATAAAPDQPDTSLGRVESAPTPADEPSATPSATSDAAQDPAWQSALAYLRALKPPLTYGFDAGTLEYLVRTVGGEHAASIELFRNKDPRVLAERARNIKGPPA